MIKIKGEKIMKIVAVIPARYSSTRFPGKPLSDICGKPMIWWVYNQTKKVKGLSDVYAATDDTRIKEVCEKLNINVIMTSENNSSSTERLYEVSKAIDADLYICINGDEPLIDPKVIEKIIPKNYDKNFYVGNLITEIKDPAECVDFTNIKVVTDCDSNALFMSRSPIPYPKNSITYKYYKHVGVLIYTKSALKFFAETKKGENEKIEDINELRFIENGKKIKMTKVNSKTLSVDTPKDLEKVRKIMQQKIDNGEIVL